MTKICVAAGKVVEPWSLNSYRYLLFSVVLVKEKKYTHMFFLPSSLLESVLQDKDQVKLVFAFFLLLFSFFFFFWLPHGTWSSQTRDQTRTAVVTHASASAVPDP